MVLWAACKELNGCTDKFDPDRIIIESSWVTLQKPGRGPYTWTLSGSAFPATLALQIHDLEAEYPDFFKLDAIITVVDAENFTGYEDTSPTAKMQAKYTDMIVIVGSFSTESNTLTLI